MAQLPANVIKSFIKEVQEVTIDSLPPDKIVEKHARAKIVDGELYAKIDGGELAPCSTTVAVRDNDRVKVQISNHHVTIIGNLDDSPLGANALADILDGALNDFVITNSSIIDSTFSNGLIRGSTIQNSTIEGSKLVDSTITGTKIEDSTIDGTKITNASIDKSHIAQATYEYLDGRSITAVEGQIDHIIGESAEFNTVKANALKVNDVTAEQITSSTGYIDTLKAKDVTTDELEASTGYINDLASRNVSAEKIEASIVETNNLSTNYAKIDFANVAVEHVEQAWIQQLMVQGKIIAQEGTIYYLDAVHINADIIDAGTMKADRLLLRGENGLFYEINMTLDGVTAEQLSSEDYQNYIHGEKIMADTITAKHINVADLYALNANLGGWVITENAIYSGSRSEFQKPEAVGTYLGSDGRVDVGSDNEYIRFDPTTGELEITSNNIKLNSNQSLNDQLVNLNSLIQQTSDSVNFAFSKSNGLAADWNVFKMYFKFNSENMEIGRQGNQIIAKLTNNAFGFVDGPRLVSYIGNNSMYVSNSTVMDTLRFNDFVWQRRANGNMALKRIITTGEAEGNAIPENIRRMFEEGWDSANLPKLESTEIEIDRYT